MKKTAVGELIEYFVKQQKEGCSHWCIHDLIAQLYVAKEIERQNMLDIITIYHNNLFYIPLKDGENKQILEMILNGTITNK